MNLSKKKKGLQNTLWGLQYELLQLENVKLVRFYTSRLLCTPYLIKVTKSSNVQKYAISSMTFKNTIQWHSKILLKSVSTIFPRITLIEPLLFKLFKTTTNTTPRTDIHCWKNLFTTQFCIPIVLKILSLSTEVVS